MKSSFVSAFAAFALLIVAGCATLDPGGGSGTETTTGIVGALVTDKGAPASDALVQLFPHDYNPVRDADALAAIPFVVTDAQGKFAFKEIRPGRYTIVATHRSLGTRMLVSGILANQTTVELPIRTLLKPGSIKVSLHAGINGSPGYVFVPGTALFAFFPGRADMVVLDSVPAGTIPQIDYVRVDGISATTLRYAVQVAPGATTTVWNSAWKYAQTLLLNTSASGANVAETVYNFPVLIRLNAGNFDFSQAAANGQDLRFTAKDTTPLRYEIERWDPAARRAEVWVKVDTVRGNNNSQTITMYWGASAGSIVPSLSNSATVFDTAAGFQGVWHLGDGAGDPIRDATANAYHGMSPDASRPQAAEGIAGRCRVFDGVSDYITMPNTAQSRLNFQENGYYTISAWVNLDTLDGAAHLIVAKGYEQYFLRCTYFPTNTPLWEFTEFKGANSWQTCTSEASSGQWVHLVGVRQGSRHLLYCNGVLVDSMPRQYLAPNLSRNTSFDLSIGKFLEIIDQPNDSQGSCPFKGAIDEVRILNTAQSAGWVRLCYMNQQSDDRLVVFK